MWHNATKPVLDFELADRIAQFHCQTGLETLEPLEGGFFASVYAAVLKDKRKVVFKIAPAGQGIMTYEQNMIHAEHAMVSLFKQIGLPVPEVIAFDASRQFLERPFLIMSFLEGEPYPQVKASLSTDAQTDIEQQLGQILRRVHQITGTGFGGIAPQAVRKETWREAFLEMLHQVLLDGEKLKVRLPCNAEVLEQQIHSVAAVLDDVRVPRLVMFDLWDGNLLIDPSRGISGIIDLERALWGDPLLEYQFKSLQPSPAFVLGYGSNPLLEPSAPMRRSLYNLFLALIMVIECDYRKYTSPEPEQWSRAFLDEELKRFETMRLS
jgi:aminoglycoside phosphotransferase (APT) family kinase protein